MPKTLGQDGLKGAASASLAMSRPYSGESPPSFTTFCHLATSLVRFSRKRSSVPPTAVVLTREPFDHFRQTEDLIDRRVVADHDFTRRLARCKKTVAVDGALKLAKPCSTRNARLIREATAAPMRF
jgi:hypothetical protein